MWKHNASQFTCWQKYKSHVVLVNARHNPVMWQERVKCIDDATAKSNCLDTRAQWWHNILTDFTYKQYSKWKNVLLKLTACTHLQATYTLPMFPLQGVGFDPFSMTKSRCVALQEGIHSPVCLQLAFKCAHTWYTNAKKITLVLQSGQNNMNGLTCTAHIFIRQSLTATKSFAFGVKSQTIVWFRSVWKRLLIIHFAFW